jgi:hypothetical protein
VIADEDGEIYISFNNNNRDYPVRNALMMRRLLGQPVPSEPLNSLSGDLFDSL